MNRPISSVVAVVAGLGLAALAVPGAATAAPGKPDLPTAQAGQQARGDYFPDHLAKKRSALRQRAVDQLVAGQAQTVGKGKNRTIRMVDGTRVDYPVTQSAELLTFLVQFGDGAGNPDFPENTAGPLHDEIPQPGVDDNTTYWKQHFSRDHYLDMFFNGMPEQHGESFKDVYNEMSSGRFELDGDVSDWVTVPHPAAFYQTATDDDGDPSTPPIGDESGTAMTNFLQDSADAWYQDQLDAGKTPQEIKDYLASFDVWDRYDADGDGVFNEPDGYIDHFQAIHAGEGEEAGAPTWMIWSHRSSVNSNGHVGPPGNENGGIEIGDTGLWIRDYTTEPENGGLGVFAHEFGHDLGLPDYYDTVDPSGLDNGTGFWNLMSSGSWMGHGEGAIGTTPDHMGATEKLFLGWYGDLNASNPDLVMVNGTDAPKKVVLGPSYHATNTGAQAVAVALPKGSATVDVVEPEQGTHYFYSGNGDDRVATLTSPQVTVPAGDPTLSARVSFSIETDWDYAYAQVSDDGGATWTNVETNRSTTTDPNQANEGFGITGCSGVRDADDVCDNAWTDLTADLADYAGQDVKVRFEMVNDPAYHELGLSVDSVKLGGDLVTDVEDGAPGWTLDGFRVMDGSSYALVYDQYYLAENRQYTGYDKTLAQGPYSFDYRDTAPNKVDHFPYQDGLLVWYANGRYADNNTSSHPGGGQALPVDANPTYRVWTEDGDPASYASGRLSTYDSTFDVDKSAALHLRSASDFADPGDPPDWHTLNYDVPARAGNPVFDDSVVDQYWDNTWRASGFFSTKVAGVGTMIQVLSSNESTGAMTIKVGKRFATFVKPVQINGAAKVGQLLKVTHNAWPTKGARAFTWKVGGKVAGKAATYRVQPKDLGKRITVSEKLSPAGYTPASSTSAPTAKVKAGQVKLVVKAPKQIKKGKRASATVVVKVTGLTPTGKVRLTFGGKSVRAKVLKHGKTTFRLPAQGSLGRKALVVKYTPGKGYVKNSKTVVVRIVR